MNKSKLIGSLAFALLFTVTSCTKHTEELKHLNELKETLEANRNNFDLDMQLFETRKEFIATSLRTIANEYTDTITLELGNSLSRYKAIKKIYDKNISTFAKNEKDQNELEQQLVNLETDLKNGKLSKEEFKAFYNQEKTDVLSLIESSKNVKKVLYQVEPDYKRITEEVVPILEELEN